MNGEGLFQKPTQEVGLRSSKVSLSDDPKKARRDHIRRRMEDEGAGFSSGKTDRISFASRSTVS